jgi:hypothetical protein
VFIPESWWIAAPPSPFQHHAYVRSLFFLFTLPQQPLTDLSLECFLLLLSPFHEDLPSPLIDTLTVCLLSLLPRLRRFLLANEGGDPVEMPMGKFARTPFRRPDSAVQEEFEI